MRFSLVAVSTFAFGCFGVVSSASAAPVAIYNPSTGLSYYVGATGNLATTEAAAVAAGGHLASIHSNQENDAVRGLISVTSLIGFNDRASEGNFVWTDGSSNAYTHWNGGEPNNSGGNENATEINTSGGWNDINETNSEGSVAQKPGVIAQSFGGKNYVVLVATDWDSALAQAHAIGGTLASVHSSTQNSFFQSLIPNGQGSAWIGFNDKAVEGTFVWTDGSPVDYLNWNGGEPNNFNNNEDATELSATGGWNDLDESQLRFAIVELTPEPGNVSLALGALAMGATALVIRRHRAA